MPNKKSAEKRVKQSAKRRQRNKGYQKRIKEISKEIEKKIKENAEREELLQLLSKAFKVIDTAKSNGAVHRNYAARKKSKLHFKVKKYLGEVLEEEVSSAE